MLKDIRQRRGLSLRALAEKSGVSHGYICLLENGKRPLHGMTVRVVEALTKALDCTVDDLMN